MNITELKETILEAKSSGLEDSCEFIDYIEDNGEWDVDEVIDALNDETNIHFGDTYEVEKVELTEGQAIDYWAGLRGDTLDALWDGSL